MIDYAGGNVTNLLARVAVIIVGLIVPFLHFTEFSSIAYIISLGLVGYTVYRLDTPSIIAKRDGVPELLRHRTYLRITGSIYYVLLFFLINKFVEDALTAIQNRIFANQIDVASVFVLMILDVIAIMILIFSVMQAYQYKLGKEVIEKLSGISKFDSFMFVLAMGGDVFVDLILAPALAIRNGVLNLRKPIRLVEEIEKFDELLFAKWFEIQGGIPLFFGEVMVLTTIIISINLGIFLVSISSSQLLISDLAVFSGQLVFICLSCAVPGLGSYFAIGKSWKHNRIVPIILLYTTSIPLMIIFPKTVPFLWLMSQLPEFSNPIVLQSGAASFASLMIGFLIIAHFRAKLLLSEKMDDRKGIEKGIKAVFVSLSATFLVSVAITSFAVNVATGQIPIFAFFAVGMLPILYKLVEGHHSRKLKKYKETEESRNYRRAATLLPGEKILHAEEEYTTKNQVAQYANAKGRIVDELYPEQLFLVLTNLRLVRIWRAAGKANSTIFNSVESLSIREIESVDLAAASFFTVKLIIHTKYSTKEYWPRNAKRYREVLLNAIGRP